MSSSQSQVRRYRSATSTPVESHNKSSPNSSEKFFSLSEKEIELLESFFSNLFRDQDLIQSCPGDFLFLKFEFMTNLTPVIICGISQLCQFSDLTDGQKKRAKELSCLLDCGIIVAK